VAAGASLIGAMSRQSFAQGERAKIFLIAGQDRHTAAAVDALAKNSLHHPIPSLYGACAQAWRIGRQKCRHRQHSSPTNAPRVFDMNPCVVSAGAGEMP